MDFPVMNYLVFLLFGNIMIQPYTLEWPIAYILKKNREFVTSKSRIANPLPNNIGKRILKYGP